MNNKNLLFIIYFLVFTISLDFFLGYLHEALYFSEKSKKNDRLIHSVFGTNEDILIFGSSRALHHYNPQIIENALNMTCYNVGYGGQNIFFHLALLESALERYTPKVAILELMSIDFEKTPPQWDTEKLAALLPFAKTSLANKQAVLLRGASEEIKLYSGIYPFNSLQYIMLRNNFLPIHNNIKGFIPIEKVWTKQIAEDEIKSQREDENKVKALYRFVETSQSHNIALFVFVSPHYVSYNRVSIYSDISKRLLDLYKVNVINFEKDSDFLKHPEYFADPNHLNRQGADLYTSRITKYIKL